MLRTLLVAASAAAALAACANQCNGHGTCNNEDRCDCYEGYTGNDCSYRVCSKGLSQDLITDSTQQLAPVWAPPKRHVGFLPATPSSVSKLDAFLNNGYLGESSMGLEVRVVRVDSTKQEIKFQLKTNTDKTFGSEITASMADPNSLVYTSRPTALHVRPAGADTGLYIFFDLSSASDLTSVVAGDRYYLNVSANAGVRFIGSDGNTAHQMSECSGRGVCDRSSGQCKCTPPYTGDACQRTACPNDCSGHGICQSQKYFVADAGLNFGLKYEKGFDADASFGCLCDNGYRGPSCALRECPSGPDPMGGNGGSEGKDCSGRGVCNYGTGTCTCFKGFFGTRCETLSVLV